MKVSDHLGFRLSSSSLTGNVWIPKYYNPEIFSDLEDLTATHDLVPIGELVANEEIVASTGDEIGKMAYGTGTIPFVRTTDIFNWEIKADPKQGISEEIYSSYFHDVKEGDVLFVRDGTYLIGSACLVSPHDERMLYQSHLLKFRTTEKSRISGALLLALLTCPVVRRQIKAKQFTADIIDTIGHRYLELELPIPKSEERRRRVEKEVKETVYKRADLREKLRRVPFLAQGLISSVSDPLPENTVDAEESITGYVTHAGTIRNNIFLPRYYNPALEEEIRSLSVDYNLVSLGELADREVLSFATGIEVGKMAYGMGSVPFIRTSDISNWELKADPKQSVSEELYEETRATLDVQANDIFVVRDGTYLVGTSCILTEHDTKILYCGGLYKIRVHKKEVLDPYLLLALLNTPIVRRQMKAKQFTRDVIDTLGKRLFEVVLPIPKSADKCEQIAKEVRELIETRVGLRNRAKEIALEVQGIERLSEEDAEVLEELLPLPLDRRNISHRAVAVDKDSRGRTAGEALDALTTQLAPDAAGLMVVVQSLLPDRFFGAPQQQRLSELMRQWHAAQDAGGALTAGEQAELDALADAELRASGARAGALADELGR